MSREDPLLLVFISELQAVTCRQTRKLFEKTRRKTCSKLDYISKIKQKQTNFVTLLSCDLKFMKSDLSLFWTDYISLSTIF